MFEEEKKKKGGEDRAKEGGLRPKEVEVDFKQRSKNKQTNK